MKATEVKENEPKERLIKHPLEHTWSFWYYQNIRGKSWEENQKEVTSFSTVEDFWCLHNHIKPPNEVQLGVDYSVFKKGIRPMWEDSANAKGGSWIVRYDKKKYDTLINDLWRDLLLYMIGNCFGESGREICGANFYVRHKIYRFSIWTTDASKKDDILNIGEVLKRFLIVNNDLNLKLVYETHESYENKRNECLYTITL